jgi:hypothetical protein
VLASVSCDRELFSKIHICVAPAKPQKDSFGATPKPTRETRVLTQTAVYATLRAAIADLYLLDGSAKNVNE